MKRVWSFLLAACLLTASLAACSSEGEYQPFPDQTVGECFDIAYGENQIYLAGSEAVYVYSQKGEEQKKIELPGKLVSCVAADGTMAYGVAPSPEGDHELLLIDTKTGKVESRALDVTFSDYMDALRLCKAGDSLYLLKATEDKNWPALYRYHLESGELYDLNIEGIRDFSLYQGEDLVVKIGQAGPVYRVFDTETESLGEELPICQDFRDSSVYDFCYDPQKKQILYSGMDWILSHKLEGDQKDERVVRLPSKPYEVRMALGPNAVYLLCRDTETLSVAPKVPLQEKSAGNLRVLGGVYELQESFEKKFAGKMMIADGVVDAGELAEKIAAGDDSFDLYYLDSNLPGAQRCLEENAFYPLDKLAGVEDYFKKFPEKIGEHCRREGKLFGLPDSITTAAMSCSPELETEYGDSLLRWDTAMERGEAVFAQDPSKTLLGSSGVSQDEMLRQYLCAYGGKGQREFDTPEFRLVLRQMKQAQEYVGFQIATDPKGEYQMTLKRDLLYWLREETSLMAPPRIGDEAEYPLQMRWLLVNPNTQNLELVLDFLEYYIASDEPEEHRNLLPREPEAELSRIQRENHQVYLEILEKSAVAYCPRDLIRNLQPVLQAYYQEEIDLEAAVAKIEEIARES